MDDEILAGLRRPLLAFCYQMLGSPFEAEDALQDTLERAWRARDSFDPERGRWSTWCHRIAHNVCVDRLRGTGRRVLPHDLQDAGLEVGAPLVPAPDVPWLMPAPRSWFADSEPGSAAEQAADVRLAVTAVLQTLPGGQRAVFVLRELLGWPAAETGAVLGLSPSAVHSSLQRARAAVAAGTPRPAPVDRARVERYARALERADVAALVSMVSAEVTLDMPPVPAWSRGREPYAAFMAHLFAWRGTAWTARLVASAGQPAFLLYRGVGPDATPHTLQLLEPDGSGSIGQVLVYADPRLFTLFATADEFRAAAT